MHLHAFHSFEALDLRQLAAKIAELVNSIAQAIAGEGVDLKRHQSSAGKCYVLGAQIDVDLRTRVGKQLARMCEIAFTCGSPPTPSSSYLNVQLIDDCRSQRSRCNGLMVAFGDIRCSDTC